VFGRPAGHEDVNDAQCLRYGPATRWIVGGKAARGFAEQNPIVATRLEQIAHGKARDSSAIKVWFADEARVGQKNKLTYRWAKRGTRPSAPRDQHAASTCIFGAVCPGEGKGAALILPSCNTEAMNLHLAEMVAPDAHAVLLVDQANWHLSARLVIPSNITILPLPAKSPELSPSKTSGRSCATIGSQTTSSSPTTIPLTTAAPPGTSWSINPGASCQSRCEIGQRGSD